MKDTSIKIETPDLDPLKIEVATIVSDTSILANMAQATRLRAARLMAANDDEILMVAREFADWVDKNFDSTKSMQKQFKSLFLQQEAVDKEIERRRSNVEKYR